jgi:dTDP-4-amino-4,6-dideoxygalactose transaminase
MDTEDLKFKINDVIKKGDLKPKVIIPVDLFGLLADYEKIEKIASMFNLLILEDAAQGFGASHNDKKACSYGHAATTSFFPAKPLGCYGDGGAIFTNDDELAKLLESLRVHGKGKDKYDNIRIGVNSRLDTVQAAILDVKLDAFITHELDDVNKVHKLYNKYLSKIVKVPFIPKKHVSSFAQYTIILKSKKVRDGLKEYLEKHDIPSIIYYNKPMHKQLAFKDLNVDSTKLKTSLFLSDTVLSLPMHPYLTEEEIHLISSKIIYYILNETK